MDIVQLANEFCAKLANITDVDVAIRQKLFEGIPSPRCLEVVGSSLKFYVHSIIEDARIRKFKEPWTIQWLRDLPNDAILYDIGANIGITTLIPVENVQKNVRVVAIEPAPGNFLSLVKNIELNGFNERIYALPIGLGATTDIACFKLTTHEPGGAMHSFGEILMVKTDQLHKQIGYHYCLRMRLDDLVRLPGLPFPTHIKIDIDGGELDFLLGAAQVITDARCRGVQIEVVDSDEKHLRSNQVTEVMIKAGFSLKESHNHNNVYPRVIDLQFVRL